jgi:hypothetical protein
VLATAAAGLLTGGGGAAAAGVATSGSPALAATEPTPDWINVLTYGADPTGAADSTGAIKKAIAALPFTGGVIYLPAGTYKVSSVVTCSKVPAGPDSPADFAASRSTGRRPRPSRPACTWAICCSTSST